MRMAVIALVLLTGCAKGTQYQWSSLAGRDCFWSCQNIVNTCNASCGGGVGSAGLILAVLCTKACINQGKSCASSCPDLAMVSK